MDPDQDKGCPQKFFRTAEMEQMETLKKNGDILGNQIKKRSPLIELNIFYN